MRKFNPTATHPERAVQAWQILVGMAKNRQTATYKGLSVLMYGKPAAGVLSQILDRIARYCNRNGLPTLNSIVVGQGRGTPGSEIPLDPADFDKERERVYALDWFDIYPPSSKDFAD